MEHNNLEAGYVTHAGANAPLLAPALTSSRAALRMPSTSNKKKNLLVGTMRSNSHTPSSLRLMSYGRQLSKLVRRRTFLPMGPLRGALQQNLNGFHLPQSQQLSPANCSTRWLPAEDLGRESCMSDVHGSTTRCFVCPDDAGVS